MSELAASFVRSLHAPSTRGLAMPRLHDVLLATALAFSVLGAFGSLQHLHLVPLIGIVGAMFMPLVKTQSLRIAIPKTIGFGALLLIAGGTASVFASADRRESIWQLIFAIIVPFVFYVAIGVRSWRPRMLHLYLGVLAIACSIPLLAGLAAFYRAFGVPADMNALVWARFDLLRIAPYQDATFGNVLHTADLILLILPPLVALAIETRGVLRLAGIAGAAIAASNVLIVAARGATVILLLSLIYFLWRIRNRRALFALIVAGCFWAYREIDMSVLEPVLKRYQALAFGQDASGYERLDAMRNAVGLIGDHFVSGVGLGNYYLVDPVYTAAHEMILHLGVETGVAGLTGIALLLWGAVASAVRVFRDDSPRRLALACSIGLLAYTLNALIAGSNFAVVGVNVWGMLFWFYLRVCEESTASSRPVVLKV